MLFNSFIFFMFLAVVLPIFYLLPNKKSKNTFLVLSSYLFYGYWDWRFCILLLISTIVDFFIGKILHNSKKQKTGKRLLLISCIVNLGILGLFKYYNFFISSFNDICLNFGFNLDYLHLNIILPVGISFYTFQTLSYTIDIYRKRLEPTSNLIDFALFVSFFPQLVAGPIERAKALLPQLSKKLAPTKKQIEQGVVLIVLGLFRKVMIGDTAGRIVDHLFSQPALYKSWELVCALILFSIQIYADFSGYSHIARGVAKLLGIELMKNFEQPYLSRNITEFWRRWHISLSSWLKDYLYISLGGNRKGKYKTYLNLMITMLLGGLWHGASWNFVIWGGLHGIYLAIHKLFLGDKKIKSENYNLKGFKNTGIFIVQIVFTYVLVLFTWLFFRSNNWETTKIFFSKIINWEVSDFTYQFSIITISFMFMTILLDLFEYSTKRHTFLLMLKKPVRYGIMSVLFMISLIYIFLSDPLPFVYFQF